MRGFIQDSQLVDVQKERFSYRYLNWFQKVFLPQWGGIEIPWCFLHHDPGALGVRKITRRIPSSQTDEGHGSQCDRTTHSPTSEQTLKIAAELGLMVRRSF